MILPAVIILICAGVWLLSVMFVLVGIAKLRDPLLDDNATLRWMGISSVAAFLGTVAFWSAVATAVIWLIAELLKVV